MKLVQLFLASIFHSQGTKTTFGERNYLERGERNTWLIIREIQNFEVRGGRIGEKIA